MRHGDIKTIIEAIDLSFSKGEKKILKEIDFTAKTGELWGIIGPNGAGKSSLMSLLAREKQLQKGIIKFKRKPFEQWRQSRLVLHKAKFSQEYNPDIGLSVEEIVMMGRYPYFSSAPSIRDREIVKTVMQKLELQDYGGRPYNSLSGGEKQRVHLARILAQLDNEITPKIAFFDEPLNNLDVRHQYRILEEIKAFVRRGNTAIIILHDLNLAAEFAGKIILMKEGKIIAHGSPETVFCPKLLNEVYDFPCTVCTNPITNCPMIVFNRKNRTPVEKNRQTL